MSEGRRAHYILVVTIDALAAPTVLFFSALGRMQPGAIRIAEYHRDSLAGLIGGAAAIVFVRGLFEFGEVISCAARLGIPRYYFLDDHFILVREQGGAAAAFAQEHSQENVAAILRGFAGVLASTVPLQADLGRRRLHTRIELFPPVLQPTVAAKRPGPLGIAFFGGAHLHGIFHRAILPAARRLARDRAVKVIAVGMPDAIASSAGLQVVALPYQRSYVAGVAALASEGVDILVHPVAHGLLSNPFKNPHALITAHSLGAVPVVSNAEPYAALRGDDIAILCGESEEAWYRGLLEAVTPGRATGLQRRLAEYCRSHYDGALNQQVWHGMLAAHGAPSAVTAAFRAGVAAMWLGGGRLRRGLQRVAAVRLLAAVA